MRNLKKTLFCIAFFFAFIYANAQQYDTLYNKTIISLTKMGLPAQTIISKINTSITSFDVSINALMDLQSNGVNGEVINVMIKRNDNANTKAVINVNSKNPNEMHRPGIYYFDQNDKENPLKRVDATVTSTSKSGGFGVALAQAYTNGIANDNLVSAISGSNSHLQVKETNLTFYFYFENNANPNTDSWFFAQATSPNEFICVKLKEKRNRREMEVGSANAYGSTSGIPDKKKMPFEYEQVAEGIYKVSFKNPLKDGEYCFLYASATPTRYSNNKVFDFGILKKDND
ncbi:MAG: hypothetical protein HXX18_05840 [Bacteroidetes bacterium]|nr:hypothetical protein [Bacteroidota bacterium]